MKHNKLREIEELHRELRLRKAVQAREIEELAQKLGRKQHHRGKEPAWISTEFPSLYPITIPRHGKSDLKIGTKNNILRQLQEDIDCFKQRIGAGVQDEGI